jgi:hypothetical protein
MEVSCLSTSCHCSSWCNDFVATIIGGMKTTAEFDCVLATGDCNIKRIYNTLFDILFTLYRERIATSYRIAL